MRNRSVLLRFLTTVLAFCVMICVYAPVVFAENEAEEEQVVEHQAKQYEIAVVYDNSGSMYELNGKPEKMWCYAKYAMEIFASMLDYSAGDRLHIFPMWKVATDGSTPTLEYEKCAATAEDRIDISDVGDIDKINKMYTIIPQQTPFTPVQFAMDYLSQANGDAQKWLVVLTDGVFDGVSTESLQQQLLTYASRGVHVQYLAIGDEAKAIQGNPDAGLFANKSGGTDLKDTLVSICNTIFERHQLPDSALSGNNLKLDISMRKLIVFAQGKDAAIHSLQGADGSTASVISDSGRRTYSTMSAGGSIKNSAPYDDSLAGQVVTFDSCKQGSYLLDATGAEKVQVFYEPDVRIVTKLISSDGIELGEDDKAYSGEYTVRNEIVDRQTGDIVTDSPLLGKNIKYDCVMSLEDGTQVPFENGGKITLEKGDNARIAVEATYLDEYKIRNDDSRFAKGFSIEETSAHKLEVKIEDKQAWYELAKHEDWKPLRITILCDGQPLTAEQFAAANVSFAWEPKIVYSEERNAAENVWLVKPGYNEKGEYVKPDTGSYKLSVQAVLADEHGLDMIGKAECSIGIRLVPPYVIYAGIGILLLLLGLLLFLILNQKVLPKRMKGKIRFLFWDEPIEGSGNIARYNRKAATLEISSITPPGDMNAACNVMFSLYPVGKRYTPSKIRQFGIRDVTSAAPGVTGIKINHGRTYERTEEGRFRQGATRGPEKDSTIDYVGANITVEVFTETSRLECKFDQK